MLREDLEKMKPQFEAQFGKCNYNIIKEYEDGTVKVIITKIE